MNIIAVLPTQHISLVRLKHQLVNFIHFLCVCRRLRFSLWIHFFIFLRRCDNRFDAVGVSADLGTRLGQQCQRAFLRVQLLGGEKNPKLIPAVEKRIIFNKSLPSLGLVTSNPVVSIEYSLLWALALCRSLLQAQPFVFQLDLKL